MPPLTPSDRNFVTALKDVKESDERFRLLVSSVRDYAIFLLDPKGIVQSWNAGAQAFKGYTAAEAIGKSFQIFYTREDVDRGHPLNELRLALQKGRYEEEGWRVRKDGTQFWASVVITSLTNENGEHIGFAKVTRDLSERKKNEESLRQSEERLRLIIESVKDYAIIMLDPAGQIMSWNAGAHRLKGYTAEEIQGRHFSVFYSEDEVAMGKCEYELEEATLTGRFEDEGWRLRKNGTKFWANVVITALRTPDNELIGFAKVTRDLTDRKRAEDILKMAHQNLEKRVIERTEALEKAVHSRDEFLSVASHELRTPLTALKLQQQLLERQAIKDPTKGLTPEKVKELTEMTGRQITRLTRLIDDMFDVSRIATGQLQLKKLSCDFSDLVTKTVEVLSPTFQAANVKLNLDIDEKIMVVCDAERIEQVINNLISNAIKYGASSTVTINAKTKNGKALLSVKDQGPGISQDDQKRIFDRFERAVSANEISGLGLGLYITKQIVDAHHGKLSVKSQVGLGAIFTVELPL